MAITIRTEGLGDETLRRLADMFTSPRQKQATHAAGGRAVQSFLKRYHRNMSRNREWDNPDLPTHGRGRKSTRFGTAIYTAWQAPEATPDHVEVVNTDERLNQKVYGGTITPKKSRWLTIPWRPDAHGRSVKEWMSRYPKRKLFRPRKRDYLAYRLADGSLRIAYLLRKSVTQKAWPNALPTGAQILDAYWEEGVEPRVDKILAARVRAAADKRREAKG